MAKKRQKAIWVVVQGSPDIARHFVEIRGVFLTVEAARAWRQELWDRGERPQADIRHFIPGEDL